jgi:MFS family permease
VVVFLVIHVSHSTSNLVTLPISLLHGTRFSYRQIRQGSWLLVGAIGSAFMVGRATTAVLWGIAADKYGRKPVMLIGLISV